MSQKNSITDFGMFEMSTIKFLVHCEWGEWTIRECDKTCGGGIRTKTRVKKIEARNGGNQCDGPTTIDDICNSNECPGIT